MSAKTNSPTNLQRSQKKVPVPVSWQISYIIVIIWVLLKIILVLTGSISIILLYVRKRNRGKLFKTHSLLTIVSILGGIAGMYMFGLGLFYAIKETTPFEHTKSVWAGTIMFLFVTVFEIIYSNLLVKHEKYCLKINKTILISQVLITIVLAVISMYSLIFFYKSKQ